jgi:hypothetical protein
MGSSFRTIVACRQARAHLNKKEDTIDRIDHHRRLRILEMEGFYPKFFGPQK